MSRFIIALLIVLAFVVGGLLAFRRNRYLGQPSPEVIERAKQRERELQARERAEGDD